MRIHSKTSQVSVARRAAFSILLDLEDGQSHADAMLRSRSISKFSATDRHLATALVMGVIRWQLLLDEQLRACLQKPNAKIDLKVRLALRLGAYQILHMDRIPARAAIDESVELTKEAGHRFAAGLVNAVLRKLAAQPRPESVDPQAAYPAWMAERWLQNYGAEATQAICQHGQQAAPAALRLTHADAEAALTEAGIVLEPGRLLTQARLLQGGEPSVELLKPNARWQDEGSQLAAELACAFPADGESILDACAAPGGKTLILDERFPKAKIVACEVNPMRCGALQKRLQTLAPRVDVRLADATQLPAKDTYSRILLDAPCTGTGTLGRNPEIRHRLQFDDLARQAERQRDLLRAAYRALRPGGLLLYSTCSLEPEENQQVVDAVVAETGAERLPMRNLIEDRLQAGVLTRDGAEKLRAALTPQDALQLLPGQTDGFFLAALGKPR